MNFNKGAGVPGQAPGQQLFPRQRPNFPMLPPQFQNLSPQQLQELKNQPQFQNIVRQYFQRQQALQQQQIMRQQAAMGQGPPPTQDPSRQQNLQYPPRQNLGQQMPDRNIGPADLAQQHLAQGLQKSGLSTGSLPTNMPMQAPGAGVGMQSPGINPQAAAAVAAAATANPNTLSSMPRFNNQFSQQAMAQNMAPRMPPQVAQAAKFNDKNPVGGMVGNPMAQMPSGTPNGTPASMPMLMPPNAMLTIPGPMAGAFPVNAQGGPPVGSSSMPPVAGSASMAAAAGGNPNGVPFNVASGPKRMSPVREDIKLPPGFAPDSLGRIDWRPLNSSTEWSDKLKADDEPIPTDVKVYEDLIKKDSLYLKKYPASEKKIKEQLGTMARDIKTLNAIKQLRMNAINASAKNQYNNSIWGEGYQGYGNGISNTATQVVLPLHNKLTSKLHDVKMSDRQINEQLFRNKSSGKCARWVPIRLEFDQERDRFKLRDTFLWNLNDETYPVESFVRTLLDDYKFISEHHYQTILMSVREQLKDFKAKPEKTMGELRVPIKIDMIINNTQFTDQFEWDILNYEETDPEEFSTILCDEMNFPGEFATAIAFSIREQTQLYHKALYLVGYNFDGSAIREDEIRSHLLPALRTLQTDDNGNQVEDFVTGLRNPALVADFSPSLSKLNQLEVEKIDKEMERESRRRRRHFNTEFSYAENGPAMSGGVNRGTASRRSGLHFARGNKTTLPDLSDMPRNFRTPMPSSILPGGIDLGVPDIYGYNELIVNRAQIKNPDYKPPPPPGLVVSYRDGDAFMVKIKVPR